MKPLIGLLSVIVLTARSQTLTVVSAASYTAPVAPDSIAVAFDNLQTELPVFKCDNGPGTCASVPLGLGVDTPVYLTLFGTGIRGRGLLGIATCTIGGVTVPVLFAGAQSQFPGLDQVNVPVVLGLRGKGEMDLVLTVDGQAANTVRVNVQ